MLHYLIYFILICSSSAQNAQILQNTPFTKRLAKLIEVSCKVSDGELVVCLRNLGEKHLAVSKTPSGGSFKITHSDKTGEGGGYVTMSDLVHHDHVILPPSQKKDSVYLRKVYSDKEYGKLIQRKPSKEATVIMGAIDPVTGKYEEFSLFIVFGKNLPNKAQQSNR